MTKLPSFQFYPGDWMKDPNLRACSICARGLWIDLLCMMHEAPRRGYLEIAAGKPYTDVEIAHMVGLTTAEVSALLSELVHLHVASRTRNGALVCRRMCRDEDRRGVWRDLKHNQRKTKKTQENCPPNVFENSKRQGEDMSTKKGGHVQRLSSLSSSSSSSSEVDMRRGASTPQASQSTSPPLSQKVFSPNGGDAALALDGGAVVPPPASPEATATATTTATATAKAKTKPSATGPPSPDNDWSLPPRRPTSEEIRAGEDEVWNEIREREEREHESAHDRRLTLDAAHRHRENH